MTGIKILYPLYWLGTLPFRATNYPENRAHQKIMEQLQQRREAYFSQTSPTETDFAELLNRPNLSFQTMVHWSDYQSMAKAMGWDPYLTMARGLRRAPMEEVEVLLEQAFGENLDSKVAFLAKYPLPGGVEILRREIAQIQTGHVTQEGFPLYFAIAQALEELERKSRTAMDMRDQPGVHPQILVANALASDLNDEIRLKSLETTLKYLKIGWPEEAWAPGLDWFESRLRHRSFGFGRNRSTGFSPEILAVLKNEKDQFCRRPPWPWPDGRLRRRWGP
jgi:hypothetical protein